MSRRNGIAKIPMMSKKQILDMQTQMRVMQDQLFQTTGFLLALLREKHHGRASVTIAGCQESQHWGVHFMPTPQLGTICLTAVQPNGVVSDPVDDAAPPRIIGASDLPPAEPEVAEEISAGPVLVPTCFWHRDPNRIGLLCPECGKGTILPVEDSGAN